MGESARALLLALGAAACSPAAPPADPAAPSLTSADAAAASAASPAVAPAEGSAAASAAPPAAASAALSAASAEAPAAAPSGSPAPAAQPTTGPCAAAAGRAERLELKAGEARTTKSGLTVTFHGTSHDSYADGTTDLLVSLSFSRGGQKATRLPSGLARQLSFEPLLGHCWRLADGGGDRVIIEIAPLAPQP